MAILLFTRAATSFRRVVAGASVRWMTTAPAAEAAASSAAAKPAYIVTELPSAAAVEPVTRRTMSTVKAVKGHTKKLSPVARQVVGLSVNEALMQMAHSPHKRAAAVKKAITKAVKQAELFHGLSQDALLVESAWTGKHMSSVRIRHHSKGRAGRAAYRLSMVSVKLREMAESEAAKLNKFKTPVTAASMAKLSPRGY